MSLLDTTETNKQLENELDKIVMEELRDHYCRADVKAFDIRCRLHDPNKGKELAAYNFYRLENRHLSRDLETAQENLKQCRQAVSELCADKTTLLAIIGEMIRIISPNLTENQKNILMQTLKLDLRDIDFARVKAYVKRLQ